MDETRAMLVGWTLFLLALVVVALVISGSVGIRFP